MIYRVFMGYDTGGEPIYYKWHCDCEKCLTSTNPHQAAINANIDEDKEKPQDTALYASLRR